MIDFAGINGVAGVAAGAFEAICPADGATLAEAGSEVATAGGGLSGKAAFFAAAVATGATIGAAAGVTEASAFPGIAGGSDAVAEEAGTADGAGAGGLTELAVEADAGVEDAGDGSAAAVDGGVACGGAAAAFCRAIEPVTESRPCSSTVMRE
jgi:hypothetical protein